MLNLWRKSRTLSLTHWKTVRTSVYFESLITRFTIPVVSDIGGLLGLFLGCSVLSIVEVFYFLFASLFRFALKNRTNSKIMTVEKEPNCQEEIIDLLLELRKDVNRLDQSVSKNTKRIIKIENDFIKVEEM